MPPLTTDKINEKLGVTPPIVPVPQGNPIVSQLETITSNIRFIVEAIVKKKDGQQPLSTNPEFPRLTNAQQDKPPVKMVIPVINRKRVIELLLSKIGVAKFLPKSITKKTIKDFLKEFETNEQTRKEVVDRIIDVVEKCYD